MIFFLREDREMETNGNLKGDSKGILTLFISIFILIILSYILYQVYAFYFPSFPWDDSLGNCQWKRWGCCKDGKTPKYDPDGTNCMRIGEGKPWWK
jgi:hypothetical protein